MTVKLEDSEADGTAIETPKCLSRLPAAHLRDCQVPGRCQADVQAYSVGQPQRADRHAELPGRMVDSGRRHPFLQPLHCAQQVRH